MRGSRDQDGLQRLLGRYGIRPQRSLGQNFLADGEVLAREVAYAELQGTETVLEIGPGPGTLTERLAGAAGRVLAVERDPQFRPPLDALRQRCANLEVVWGDALQVDLPPFDKVVSNLPFGTALPLTFRLLERRFDLAVLLYQKRLAERLCATVGEPHYGRLSVSVGRLADVELVEVVAPRAFLPAPAVDSAIVRLRRRRPRFPVPSEEHFRRLLEALFARREASVGDAARAVTDRSTVPARPDVALASLGRRLADKTVCRVTPQEFGRIARAFRDHLDR